MENDKNHSYYNRIKVKGLNPEFFTSFAGYFNESTYTMDPTRYVGILLIDAMSLKEEKLMDEIGDLTNI